MRGRVVAREATAVRRYNHRAEASRPFSGDENPTQALQLPHVTVQREQTQQEDEALEDGDFELRPLGEKDKTKNSCREHEAYAC